MDSPQMLQRRSDIFRKIRRKTPVPVSILTKLQSSGSGTLERCFPLNFCKHSRNTVFTEHVWATASVTICTNS